MAWSGLNAWSGEGGGLGLPSATGARAPGIGLLPQPGFVTTVTDRMQFCDDNYNRNF